MEINYTPIQKEIDKILELGPTETSYTWQAKIHYKDEVYIPFKVIAVNVDRDYVNNFTDEITFSALIPLGKYARRIYPNRTDLRISLTKVPALESNKANDVTKPISTEMYSATLLDEDRSPTDLQGAETNDELALDTSQMLTVHFQLYNRSIRKLRLMQFSTIFRKATVDSILLCALTNESRKAEVDDVQAVKGVHLIPASNQEQQEQVVITHGTKLIYLPDYLQKRVGVYNSGLGSYVQDKYWFIYPLYDTTQFEERINTLTIIILPRRKFSGIDRTYRKNKDALIILATGEVGFKDDSGTNYLNEGNGARFTSAKNMMGSSSRTADNKTFMNRATLNSEFIIDETADKMNHVPFIADRITANPFPIYSDLNSRNGATVKCVWENSDSKLIVPGMITRLIYSDEREVREYFGVIHQSVNLSIKANDVTTNSFSNQTILTLFVNKKSTKLA